MSLVTGREWFLKLLRLVQLDWTATLAIRQGEHEVTENQTVRLPVQSWVALADPATPLTMQAPATVEECKGSPRHPSVLRYRASSFREQQNHLLDTAPGHRTYLFD